MESVPGKFVKRCGEFRLSRTDVCGAEVLLDLGKLRGTIAQCEGASVFENLHSIGIFAPLKVDKAKGIQNSGVAG